MNKKEYENKFEKEITERTCWAIGSMFKFGKDTRIITEADFQLVYRILREAKADFPKPIPFDHPNEDNPAEPSNDAIEFYKWFKKWFEPISI
jgi:hypothetical protein